MDFIGVWQPRPASSHVRSRALKLHEIGDHPRAYNERAAPGPGRHCARDAHMQRSIRHPVLRSTVRGARPLYRAIRPPSICCPPCDCVGRVRESRIPSQESRGYGVGGGTHEQFSSQSCDATEGSAQGPCSTGKDASVSWRAQMCMPVFRLLTHIYQPAPPREHWWRPPARGSPVARMRTSKAGPGLLLRS
jgi:hypothetical protein